LKRRHHFEDDAGINITPMLDIVFIMLIFFIVTTSFIKEKGLEVARPSTTPPREAVPDAGPILVRIDGASFIILEGRILDPAAVAANLERAKAEQPKAPLIIAAHPDAETDALVAVLDAARVVGIEPVTVASVESPTRGTSTSAGWRPACRPGSGICSPNPVRFLAVSNTRTSSSPTSAGWAATRWIAPAICG
jgi:biopolymer transport protein ExbD